MADENNNKKINPGGIVVRTEDDNFGGVDNDTIDDEVTPTPRPDDEHNSDGHHHHGHSHDENIPYSDELSDDAGGMDDVIEIGDFQSPVLYANSITLRYIDEDESEIFFTLGQPSDDIDTLSTNSVDLSRYITEALTQYPGADSLNLILEPNQFGFNDTYPTRNRTESPNWSIISDFQGAVELENQGNRELPFPEAFEEFDINQDGVLNILDADVWRDEHNRPDIAGWIEAFVIGGYEGYDYLEAYYWDNGPDYYYDEDTHVNWILNNPPGTYPDLEPLPNTDTPRDFEIFFNTGTPIKTLRLVFSGNVLETENNTSYLGDFGWAFKIIHQSIPYDDVSFRDENGDGIVEEEPDEEDDGGIDPDDPLNDILIDDYSNDEEISAGFGVPGVVVEQTVFQAYDALSGLDVDTSIFENTNRGLEVSDQDGRIPLGCFVFDEDNTLQDNLPDLFNDEKFNQLIKENLIPNGDGRFVKSIWRNYTTDDSREKIFVPATVGRAWGYCTYDGVGVRKRNSNLYKGGDNYPNDRVWGSGYIEDKENGPELIASFEQFENGGLNDSGGTIDPQNVIGYAGYYPYFFDYRTGRGSNDSLVRLQYNYVTASNLTSYETDVCNKFLMQNQIDCLAFGSGDSGMDGVGSTQLESTSTHASFMIPIKCEAIGRQNPDDDNIDVLDDEAWFPNFAKWIIDTDYDEPSVSCYSNNRCLEFYSTNFINGKFDSNDGGNFLNENTAGGSKFSWESDDNMNTSNGGVLNNQYRSLNQVIQIYHNNDDTKLNLFEIIEVKFKMKTWGKTHEYPYPLPQIEVAIVDGDVATMHPQRIKDRVSGARNLPYAGIHGYWPHADFNSTRYSDDLNDLGTLNRKYSNFGSMGRFQNTETDIWETFSYTFTLSEIFDYGAGIVRPLYFIVQAAGDFYGRVWIDDMEVFESGDFIPDADVRKKLSANKFGKGDLTKYYDPRILDQLEAYQDTTAPLEAQFYFYPQHPSDEVFNQKRTPMYQDFKKGLFYIADVDWGDGSPKEFTSEPEQIDEEKALYHTYENHGVFEVTGMMMRMKQDGINSELGILKNKRFRLRINVNEGIDEDFRFFGSDGFSFIPYKNTTPIIGGISKQSAYYKSIKRQIGFLETADNEQIQTYVNFQNDGDRLKTEIAFNKIDSTFNNDLDLFNEYTKRRPIQKTLEIVEQPICETYDCSINQFLSSDKFSTPLPSTIDEQQDVQATAIMTCSPLDSECIDFYGEGAVTIFDGNTWTSINNMNDLTSMQETFTYRFGVFDSNYQAEYCNPALGCTGFGTATGIPFAGGVELFSSMDNLYILDNYIDFTIPDVTDLSYTGFKLYSEELGTSIGDLDITNIKYYNGLKPMWTLLGLQAPNRDNFRSAIGSELIQNTDFGPLEAGTYGTDEYVGNINWQHNTPPELKTDLIDGWDLFNEGPYAGNNMKLTNYYTSNFPVDDDRYPGFNVLNVNITNSGRNRLIQVISKDNIVEDGKKYRVRIELYPNEDFPPSLAFHPPVLTIDGGTNKVILQEGVNEFEWDVVFPTDSNVGKVIISNQLGQSGGHGFNLMSVSVRELSEEAGLFSTEEEADEAFSLDHPDNPASPRYWKNIIPEDYSIYNREGIIDGELADPNSEQEWLDGYYYPVLPRYGADGEFIENDFPNDNIPYPIDSNITMENEFNKDLLININSETLESNVFSDDSGNQNYGFGFVDYKPEFDNKTLSPKKRKTTKTIKVATNNGAF